jgi:hypothetical protein
MKSAIRSSLAAAYDDAVVDELLAAYEEAKTNYYLVLHQKAFAHQTGDRYWITRTGQQDVEKRKLVQP